MNYSNVFSIVWQSVGSKHVQTDKIGTNKAPDLSYSRLLDTCALLAKCVPLLLVPTDSMRVPRRFMA